MPCWGGVALSPWHLGQARGSGMVMREEEGIEGRRERQGVVREGRGEGRRKGDAGMEDGGKG